jgi:hypothetical protein
LATFCAGVGSAKASSIELRPPAGPSGLDGKNGRVSNGFGDDGTTFEEVGGLVGLGGPE